MDNHQNSNVKNFLHLPKIIKNMNVPIVVNKNTDSELQSSVPSSYLQRLNPFNVLLNTSQNVENLTFAVDDLNQKVDQIVHAVLPKEKPKGKPLPLRDSVDAEEFFRLLTIERELGLAFIL